MDTFPATVTENAVYTACWTRVGTNTVPVTPRVAAYRVEHYQERLEGGYQLAAEDTQLLYGEIGATVTAAAKAYDHYRMNRDTSAATLSGQVLAPTAGANGAPQILTLKVYYDRESYPVAYALNGGKHFAYIIGYADGTVRPEANISRAEVAAVFFRLLKSEVRENSLADVSTFADVSEDTWYNKAVTTLENLGLLQGRTLETFDPDALITRAEYAALCARLDAGDTENSGHFTNISGLWAQAEIEHASALGWIMGYEDGSFRPDNYITRAEAITLINRVLCRIPETEEDLLSGRKVWPDNRPGEWYYLAVQEATNSHDFRSKDELHEQWTQPRQGPGWTIYQGK